MDITLDLLSLQSIVISYENGGGTGENGVGHSPAFIRCDPSRRSEEWAAYETRAAREASAPAWRLWDARCRNGTRLAGKVIDIDGAGGTSREDGVDVYFADEAFLFYSGEGFSRLVAHLAQGRAVR